MPSYLPFIVMAGLVVAGGVFYALRRYLYRQLEESGGAAERARRAEFDLSVAKRQGDVMAEQKEPEDVAKDLDNGVF